ncbi:MAG: ComEC/Rec2 family competence protein [Deferrisomatales bacterium]|nr:ComEC/Rec2 family competence protein [Deferrisomatales bacterium]
MALPAPPAPQSTAPGGRFQLHHPPRPRPFAALAVAAMGGGLWLRSCPTWGLLTVAAAAVGGAWAFRGNRQRLAGWTALTLLATAGWHSAVGDLPALPAAIQSAPALRGQIAADPRPGPAGPQLTVALDAWRQEETWHPAAGRVRLGVRGTPEPPPARGDMAVFRGPLYPPQGFRNPGSGGYAAYLRREEIGARASARWPGEVLFAAPAPGEMPALTWRNRTADAIAKAAPGAGGAVLRALALGDRSGLSPATVEAFRRTGTSHVLAISGLHLGILSLLLVPALRRLLGHVPGLALRGAVVPTAHLLAVPPLVGYAALSGFQTSTLRALAMAALLLAGTALSRPVSHAGLLAGTALLLALGQPLVLADPGFQLSLAALAGLFWLAPALLERLPGGHPDPLGERVRQVSTASLGGRLRTAARGAARGLARWTLYSAAAAAATTPLAVYHFGAGSLAGALLSPAVIAVLGFVCLPLALAGLVLCPLLPGVASGLWGIGGAGAGAVSKILEQVAPVAPVVGWQRLRTPEGLLGAAALLAAATLALQARPRGRHAVGLALLGTALLVVPAAARHWIAHRDPALHLWALDVGQGQSVALRAPGGHWALVDGGGFPSGSFDVGARVVVPALEHLGATGLELVVSTHPHPDHLGGLTAAVRWGRPREVWLPGSFAEDPRYQALLDAAREVGSRVVWVGLDGHTDSLGPTPLWARWFPAAGENDRSMILRAGPPECAVLIAADLEVDGQRRLLATGDAPRCSVLVAPHHGAVSSLFPPFLSAVSPAAVVISAAGKRGLPAAQFVAAARGAGATVHGTYQWGCVHARLGPGDQWFVEPAPR